MASLKRKLRRFGRAWNYWWMGYPADSLYHEHRGTVENLSKIQSVRPARLGDGSVITYTDGTKCSTSFTPRDVNEAIRSSQYHNRFNRVFHEAKQRRGK